MHKPDMVKFVAKETGLTQKDVESVMDWTFRLIADAIKEDGRHLINGFGTFKKTRRAAVDRPNPQNRSQKVHIPAHWTVKFKPAPTLKSVVNP